MRGKSWWLILFSGLFFFSAGFTKVVKKPSPPKYAIGKGVWIQYISSTKRGDVKETATVAKWAKLDYLIVKTSDGRNWVKYNPKRLVKELIQTCHQRRIKVFAYGFVYGNHPKEEAQRAIEALRLGADGYIFDVEGAFRNKRRSAEILCSQVRTYINRHSPNKILGYSTFSRVNRQPHIPYDIFGKYCDFVMPQCYHRTFDWPPITSLGRMTKVWLEMENRWRKEGKTTSIKPLIPIAHAYRKGLRNAEYIPPEELKRFLKGSEGYFGVSIWRWELMGKEHWKVLKDAPGRKERVKRFSILEKWTWNLQTALDRTTLIALSILLGILLLKYYLENKIIYIYDSLY